MVQIKFGPPTPLWMVICEVGWMSLHLLENMPPTDKRQGGGLRTAVALILLLVLDMAPSPLFVRTGPEYTSVL